MSVSLGYEPQTKGVADRVSQPFKQRDPSYHLLHESSRRLTFCR